MHEYIYKNIRSLATPAGAFYVSRAEEKIPFSIRNNNYNVPYYDVVTETNYALDIDTDLLTVGERYDVVFSAGGLHFRGSDEYTESLTATVRSCSVGISSFDMNAYLDPDSKHTGYDVWQADNGLGFSFVLLDRTVEMITFLVAWVEHSENKNIDYEDALDFWLT